MRGSALLLVVLLVLGCVPSYRMYELQAAGTKEQLIEANINLQKAFILEAEIEVEILEKQVKELEEEISKWKGTIAQREALLKELQQSLECTIVCP